MVVLMCLYGWPPADCEVQKWHLHAAATLPVHDAARCALREPSGLPDSSASTARPALRWMAGAHCVAAGSLAGGGCHSGTAVTVVPKQMRMSIL
jgi:hypothetical protein